MGMRIKGSFIVTKFFTIFPVFPLVLPQSTILELSCEEWNKK